MNRIPHDRADALDAGRVAIDLELRRYRRRMKDLVDAAITKAHNESINEMTPFHAHKVAAAAVAEARAEMTRPKYIEAADKAKDA